MPPSQGLMLGWAYTRCRGGWCVSFTDERAVKTAKFLHVLPMGAEKNRWYLAVYQDDRGKIWGQKMKRDEKGKLVREAAS